MKIEERRLFTYPVLAKERDDYKTCRFSAEMEFSTDAAGNLVFDVKLSTNCAEINRLIASGYAEYILHAESPTTMYREIFRRGIGNFSCKIPLSFVKDKLYLITLIVLCDNIQDFFCDDWNEDFYGMSFNLPKGSILAYKNFPSVTLVEDPNLFQNVGSIFSIYRKIAAVAPFEVEMTTQKIKIGLSAKDYTFYQRYCANTAMQPILNAMIILPALVSVFDEIKQNAQEHESDAWFLSLTAAYKRRNLNFSELLASEDAFTLAQEVMSLPLTKALDNIAVAFDDIPEES